MISQKSFERFGSLPADWQAPIGHLANLQKSNFFLDLFFQHGGVIALKNCTQGETVVGWVHLAHPTGQ